MTKPVIRRRLDTLLPVLFAGLLGGCQSLSMPDVFGAGDDRQPQPGTLATLQSIEETIEPAPDTRGGTSEVSLGEVMDSYRALLPLLEDPAKQVAVRHRLADLEFQRAENKMVETAEDEMAGAIEAYEQLLAEYPERPGNDQVLYQLARAYDLRGMSEEHLATLTTLVNEHPDSPFWVEAQFRRGDLLFSNRRYTEAEQAFRTVIDADPARRDDASFLVNAHYMLGWSQFKQGNYREALFSYINVLDLVMPEEQDVESVGQEYRTMMEDLFRVFGLSLSYLDGADTLQAIFRETGEKPYEILVYDRYSDLLLEREQYTDAIDVFERYIDARPLSPWAPRYHTRIIDTLAQAGFTADIPDRKAAFVRDYGIHSAYLQQADDETAFYIGQQLEELIPELANRHYVLAGETEGLESDEHYRQAAVYYEAFADTFPAHPRTPEMLFLLGETHVELAQWPEAIEAFERVAYDFPWEGEPPERAAEAGYASVLAFREYAKTWPREPAETYNDYTEFQQLNRQRFVNAFPDDPRSEEVLYIAMQHEFERYRYGQVVEMADRMIARVPAPGADILTETWLLKAHSLFELARYAEAETTYQQALRVMAEADERRPDVIESLAASVFRQAEALADAGDTAGAVSEFLRVGVVAPTSALRANAEYDAATLLIELSHWQDAIDVMVAFRTRYPEHEQIDTLPARLALAYRETEQWEKAGDELNNLIAMATTDEEKRENLLIAADLYERAGNTGKAIDTWRRYANTYPEPLDVYMEAANSLAGLYDGIGDDSSRRFWLRKQMETVDDNPDEADDRMRYLAAEASAILAREALAYYDSIRLTLPLNQSMAAKTEALEEAVTAYQKTASYGVSSFSTEAGYQIAHIYARLGRDLMESERPEGLSELELSQYELLLEEQAYPFEDNAIDIHEQNASRARNGIFDEWVQRSYEALKTLLPGRYNKPEITVEVVDELG